MTEFFSGNARGVLLGTTVHVIKGQSSFALFVDGTRYGYCCQDGCHDSGLRDDVRKVVAKAKEAGATHVMLRTGQRSYLVEQIEGLPVLDVACHVGVIDETAEIARRYGGNEPGPSPDHVRHDRLLAEHLTLCLVSVAEGETVEHDGKSYTAAQLQERREQVRAELRALHGES